MLAEGDPTAIIFPTLIVLIVGIGLFMLATFLFRKKVKEPDEIPPAGFTLSDLRQLHKSGQILARDPRLSPELRRHLSTPESMRPTVPAAARRAGGRTGRAAAPRAGGGTARAAALSTRTTADPTRMGTGSCTRRAGSRRGGSRS